MTRRCAVLLVPAELDARAAPPGVAGTDLGRAMVTDVADLLYDLSGVDTVVVCHPRQRAAVRSLVWGQIPVIELAQVGLAAAFHWAAGPGGFAEVVIVAGDAPDLPQMILAKIFQALATFPVAVAPAPGGMAVAVGLGVPAPAWVDTAVAQASLDSPSLISDLRAAAPSASQVKVTPGWHRLRVPADLQRLDPGLEGWESTRGLLVP